jgi:hypothetical protein
MHFQDWEFCRQDALLLTAESDTVLSRYMGVDVYVE